MNTESLLSVITRVNTVLFAELGAWQRLDESRVGYFKRMYVWDACSDASIAYESADSSMVQYLAASVENDRVMAALVDALEHALRPKPDAGARAPVQLDRAYGLKISKYVFPWTQFEQSARPFDETSLPLVELELSDGRKLTTSLLVRTFNSLLFYSHMSNDSGRTVCRPRLVRAGRLGRAPLGSAACGAHVDARMDASHDRHRGHCAPVGGSPTPDTTDAQRTCFFPLKLCLPVVHHICL